MYAVLTRGCRNKRISPTAITTVTVTGVFRYSSPENVTYRFCVRAIYYFSFYFIFVRAARTFLASYVNHDIPKENENSRVQ